MMSTSKTPEITPRSVYLNRREILRAFGVGLASLALGGALSQWEGGEIQGPDTTGTDELGRPISPLSHVNSFTNFYDVSSDKRQVPQLAQAIETSPWTIEVGGLVNKPTTFDLDSLISRFHPKQTVHRMRCVEAWAAVIPWDGFPLKDLLDYVSPMPSAKWVRFETKLDPSQFLNQATPGYPWPYSEALRLDEAMHSLTMLATGMYGDALSKQNGAPIRLVVPWKYGFKGAKSLAKIELTDQQPSTFWTTVEPEHYGFFGNVNPDVHDPRWSQATEILLNYAPMRTKTMMYNGYGSQVSHLYRGLDLVKNF